LSAIFISGVTAAPGDVNIIAIKTVIAENIGIALRLGGKIPPSNCNIMVNKYNCP